MMKRGKWFAIAATVIGSFTVSIANGASAPDAAVIEKVNSGVSRFLDAAVAQDPALRGSITPAVSQQLTQLYIKSGNITQPVVSIADVAGLVRGVRDQKLLPISTLKQAVRRAVLHASETGDHSELGSLLPALHPYIEDAGYCVNDPNSPTARICSFAFGNGQFSAGGKATVGPGQILQTSLPPMGSDLAKILDCDEFTTPLVAARAAAADEPGEDGCFAFPYHYAYLYKYDLSYYGTLKIWGELLGFAVAKYPLSAGDTITVQLPVGVRCDVGCLVSALTNCFDDLIHDGSDDALICLAKKTEKHPYLIHGDGSYIQHANSVKCGVTTNLLRAENRLLFKAYQDGQFDRFYDMPEEALVFVNKDDLRFQTNNQYPPDYTSAGNEGAELYGKNMYPRASVANRDIAGKPLAILSKDRIPWWRHDFSAVRGWQFNIIYGAANVDARNCNISYSHPSDPTLVQSGDRFIAVHDTPAELQRWDYLVGFNSNHPAYLCLKALLNR